MIILGDVTHELRAVLAGAVATTQPVVVCSSRDICNTSTPATYTPQTQTSTLNSATPVPIVTSPASNHQIVIDFVSIYNGDTAAVTVTVSFYTGSATTLWKGSLAVGETLSWTEGLGWAKAPAASTAAVASAAQVLTLPEATSVPIPAADTLSIFGLDVAGRTMPGFLGVDGVTRAGQCSLAHVRAGWWNPGGTATAPGLFGLLTFTANDSSVATARTVSTTTTVFSRFRRLGYVGNAAAGRLAGARWGVGYLTLGDGAGVGGFFFTGTFGCSDAAVVAGARQWYGLQATATVTNVSPTTLTDSILIGHDASDTNLKIYYGGSAAQTPIDLGADFPANTLSNDMYEFALWASPYSTTVSYRVRRYGTPFVARGTLTGVAGTALPAATTLLGFNAVRSNNATAAAAGIDLGQIYLETEY